MASSKNGSSAGSSRIRARRSIAHMPASNKGPSGERENPARDVTASRIPKSAAKKEATDKKSRSKSLGPGGLDALQNGSGNQQKPRASLLPLKSILKPAIPVSPPGSIPSFEATRKRTPSRSPQKGGSQAGGRATGGEDLLIDFSTPVSAPDGGVNNSSNPFDSFNLVPGQSEGGTEQDQWAKEEWERREREKQAILEQRAARRKSLANRRVSFAPEATLHTWNVVEVPEDSTTSSASTNSTRRASSMTTGSIKPSTTPSRDLGTSDPPSTPPEQAADQDGSPSPAHQRDLHQKENRRSSGTDFNSPADAGSLSSSPYSGSSVAGSEDIEAPIEEDDASDSGDDSDDDADDADSTAMSMDDATVRSMATTHSNGSTTSSSGRLDQALRQASREAGTKGIDFDENGDLSMEFANQEITGAFQPWIKKKSSDNDIDINDLSSRHDQENVNPFYQSTLAHRQQQSPGQDEEDEGYTMDITTAVGGILSRQSVDPSSERRPRKSISASRRESVASRKSFGEATTLGDETMEFTNPIGGIASASPEKSTGENSSVEDDEEMTMEFTNVIGNGLINGNDGSPERQDRNEYDIRPAQTEYQPETPDSGAEEYDMDETGVIGGILPPIEERTEPQEDQTIGMEVTTATGKILPPYMHSNKAHARNLMEQESDSVQPASSPFLENVLSSPEKVTASHHLATVTSENGSPSLAPVQSRPNRRSSGPRLSATPNAQPRMTTPVKKLSTPSKQLTPQPTRPSTPGKTPPSSNVTLRSASPKKLFKPELRAKSAKNSPAGPINPSPEKNAFKGPTASLVLRPSNRESSGLGVDREGLGSPRVAEVLDRRRSIGDDASEFVPQGDTPRGVRFEDPRQIERELDHEYEEDRIASDSSTVEHDPQKDATHNLREMISRLTPKKDKVKGRKSLHVGAAKGLLGKRPIELDEDDEDEDNTPKRIKGREASPVKSVRLPAPPSKDETVGRMTASARKPTEPPPRPQNGASRRHSTANGRLFAPKEQARNRESASPLPSGNTAVETGVNVDTQEGAQEVENGDPEFEPIQLQQFLEMTNIHFMELTTTKRRHTMLHGSGKKPQRRSGEGGFRKKEASFEDRVAAGFCTVPMLELYQHSCRELKSYISEGRSIIRSIEDETYADNPPLFREYVNAAPDIRLLMDNQFRNVKTHARLQSKSMWYEWRMKLVEGLKEGLVRHLEEMNADNAVLSKKEHLLDSVVPGLIEKHASLKTEAQDLRQRAEELENCDQEELRRKREKLAAVEAQINKKRRLLEDWQEDLRYKNSLVEEGTELKANYLQQIGEAERVMEECRGWSVNEVNELKASVQDLERQTGWSIVSATPNPDSPSGPALAMSYRNDICVIFCPGAFRIPRHQTDENMPLELGFGSSKSILGHTLKSNTTKQPSPEQSLILQTLRTYLTNLPQASVAPKQLLGLVSGSWDLALGLGEEIRMLGFCGVTRPTMTSSDEKFSADPSKLRIRCILLGWMSNNTDAKKKVKQEPAAETKVRARINIDLTVSTPIKSGPEPGDAKLDVDIGVSATKAYGFTESNSPSETQMSDMLNKLICGGQRTEIGSGVWCKAVRDLEGEVFM